MAEKFKGEFRFKIPEKKFDGKLFKAARWTQIGNENAAKRWAESYRRDGYLVRIVKGTVLSNRVVGWKEKRRIIWAPGAAIIVYIKRK